MKTIQYSQAALAALRKHRNEAERILAKLERYAETGAGDVTRLVGSSYFRLRVGDFRVVFAESAAEIEVLKIAPRGEVYD
jgi:mRNA interferase RelE/StbE